MVARNTLAHNHSMLATCVALIRGGIKMIYDYTITTGKKEELNLADYKGEVITCSLKTMHFFVLVKGYT